MKGATSNSLEVVRLMSFISIHAPVKGATSFDVKQHLFSSISIHAPVKGATERWIDQFCVNIISIHAPVKGATLGQDIWFHILLISIHAPVKGATKRPDRWWSCLWRFQSTHLWKVRLGLSGYLLLIHNISIHAPVKGATWIGIPFSAWRVAFQSTHLWKVRHPPITVNPPYKYFNPRTCERCDFRSVPSSCDFDISIHAPVKGATAIY